MAIAVVPVANALRPKKGLAYRVRLSRLVTVSENIRSDLLILYRGETVDDVRQAEFRFENDRDQPIRAADFERPITVTFATPTSVLSAQVVAVAPQSLEPRVTFPLLASFPQRSFRMLATSSILSAQRSPTCWSSLRLPRRKTSILGF